MPIRPQGDPNTECAIMTMGEGGEEKREGEVPAKRRRRRQPEEEREEPCALEEMDRLREEERMKEAEENACKEEKLHQEMLREKIQVFHSRRKEN